MGLDPITPIVVGTVLVPAVVGGGTAAAAGGTALAIASANASAAALAGFEGAGALLFTSAGGSILPASVVAAGGSTIIPAAGGASGGGGLLASVGGFLASPKGLALQAGLTGGSTIFGGFAQKAEAKAAAGFADFRARGAVLEGRRKALVELERVNKEQARQFAAIGASGILPSGTAAQSALETGRKGLANVQLLQLGGQIAGRAEALQAEALRRRGRVAILGGFVSGTSRAARLISLGNR